MSSQGSIDGSINIVADLSGAATRALADGGGKVIDARVGRSDLVVLGKALVLPSSNNDIGHRPLNGSLRFHDLTLVPQVFIDGIWYNLGGESGGGSGSSLRINQNTLVGRDLPGVGIPHEIGVGAGLYIANGVLRVTTEGGTGKLVISGAVNGSLNDAEIIPLGISPFAFIASPEFSYARARVPAAAQSTIMIKKKTGNAAPVLMGFFRWEAGQTDAEVALIDPTVNELDFVFLEGPTNADVDLSDFTFLLRAGFSGGYLGAPVTVSASLTGFFPEGRFGGEMASTATVSASLVGTAEAPAPRYHFAADIAAYSDSAGTIAVTDGGRVQHWGNQGAATDDAVQTTLASAPTYRTGGLNGMPYLDVASGNFFANLVEGSQPSGLTTYNPYTVFVVADQVASGLRVVFGAKEVANSSSSKNMVYYRDQSVGVQGFAFSKSQTSFAVPNNGGANVLAAGKLLTGSGNFQRGSHASPMVTFSQTSNPASTATNGMMFLRHGSTPGGFFVGRLYEVLFYNIELSPAVCDEIIAQLAAKYNIT